jgi:phenylalanyl-tRNA synthetase beta chain
VARVLGITLPDERIEAMLKSLGLQVERLAEGFRVTPPSFRFDIEIEEDLIEEIARIHGYDNIPSLPPVARMAMMPAGESQKSAMALRRQVADRDYHEVVTYSFVEAAWEADFAANATPVVLANPIASQMGVMRSTLIGGLVGTLAANRKRQIDRVRVFEIGRCFRREAGAGPVDGFAQPLRLGGLAAGPAQPEQWGAATRRVDFYDVKADVEALFAPRRLEFVKAAHPALHPGALCRTQAGWRRVGIIGELHPRWVQKYELGTAPVVFELELPALLARHSRPMPRCRAFRPWSRPGPGGAAEPGLAPLLAGLRAAAPAIVRDVAFSMCITAKGSPKAKRALPFG